MADQGADDAGKIACACGNSERRALLGVTAALSGAALAGAVPLVMSLMPVEAKGRGAGAVEVDISALPSGGLMTVSWQGRPVWILRRTPAMLDGLRRHEHLLADPASERADQPASATGAGRAIREDIFVCVGLCTHLGCTPSAALAPGAASGLGDDWPGGFICPCHGARFDLAGRVFKGMLAQANLVIPPYAFLGETRLLIGLRG